MYRKSIYANAGVTSPPHDWDEQLRAAKAVTIRKNGKLLQAGYPPWPTDAGGQDQIVIGLIRQAGGHMEVEKRAAFNSPEGKLALEFLVEILKTVYPDNVFSFPTAVVPDFVTGRVPEVWGSAGPVAEMKQYAPTQVKDIGIMGVLAGRGPKAKEVGLTFVGPFLIAAQSKVPEQSWEVVEYLTSGEAGPAWIQTLGALPASRAVARAPYWSKDPIMSQLFAITDKYGKAVPFLPNAGEMHAIMGHEVSNVIYGTSTIPEALRSAEEKWNQILAKFYAKHP